MNSYFWTNYEVGILELSLVCIRHVLNSTLLMTNNNKIYNPDDNRLKLHKIHLYLLNRTRHSSLFIRLLFCLTSSSTHNNSVWCFLIISPNSLFPNTQPMFFSFLSEIMVRPLSPEVDIEWRQWDDTPRLVYFLLCLPHGH